MLQRFDPPLDAVARRLAYAIGRDVTARAAARSCLVLAPHEDDETLGCGALLGRKTKAGCLVRVLFASDGRYSHRSPAMTADDLARKRKAEAAEACRRLGIARKHVAFLDLEETRLWEAMVSMTRGIRRFYEASPVDEIYMPSVYDDHPDHRALASAAVELACQGVIRAPLYEYPVWAFRDGWWRRWLTRSLRLCRFKLTQRKRSIELRPLLVRTEGFLEQKRHALEAHETQMQRLSGNADWMTLEDVEEGRFLGGFFGRFELFFRFHPGIDHPPGKTG